MMNRTNPRGALPLLLGAVVLAAAGKLLLPADAMAQTPAASPATAAAPSADSIRRGEYLTRAADCIACHTTDKGRPFAGGLAFATPFGKIYSPNITPDQVHGIGGWSDDDFRRALHEGVRKDGKHLYPAFPYTAYTKLSDADVQSIRDYLNTVPANGYQPPANELSFPFNIRGMMVFWNALFFKEGRQPVVAAQTPQWNRGAYLSDALGHCAECHTPRNVMMALKDQPFAGARLQGWHAYNITPDANSGIGAWSTQDIVDYLSTGRANGKANAAGPMAEVVENSTQYLTPADLQAVAAYLKALPPIAQGETRARGAWGAPATDVATWRGAAGGAASGATLYNANCASCHGWNGGGIGADKAGAYPALPHNSVTGAADGDNLVMVILNGVHRKTAGAETFMPAFRDTLNDQDIAALANYVGGQFGNPQGRSSADSVGKLRKAE